MLSKKITRKNICEFASKENREVISLLFGFMIMKFSN